MSLRSSGETFDGMPGQRALEVRLFHDYRDQLLLAEGNKIAGVKKETGVERYISFQIPAQAWPVEVDLTFTK